MITILQILLGLFDLVGVILIGVVGALSINGIRSGHASDRVNRILSLFHLSVFTFQTQALILGITAIIALVGKTLLSIFFTRRILFFLSRRGASISANLVSRVLSQSLLEVQSRSTQETLYSLTSGVQFITINILATAAVLVADSSLLVIMGIGLLILDFRTAMITILIFSSVGIFLYRIMHVRASYLGQRTSELNILSSEKIVEVLNSYREVVVGNRRNFYASQIGQTRLEFAESLAEISFMPFISKYVIEVSIILGAVIVSVFQLVLNDVTHAISTLAIFMIAGSRIAPAFLRLQQSAVQIQGAMGSALPTLDLIDSLGAEGADQKVVDEVDLVHAGFLGSIELNRVDFTYPGAESPTIVNASINIPSGSLVAIVGPSGAGKTTLVDLVLGVLTPDAGNLSISGLAPLNALSEWPGSVGYVPQDVVIAKGTIRENVALGYPVLEATDERINRALRVASLDDFSNRLAMGIDTAVGERGTKLSGGQRQRLGIARALFTNPKLLVLDEATSSMDGETEASVASALQNLKGSVTVILIAHRLSTVRNADIVVYLDKGRIIGTGTFREVRDLIPDFDHQARLMGL